MDEYSGSDLRGRRLSTIDRGLPASPRVRFNVNWEARVTGAHVLIRIVALMFIASQQS